MEFSNTFFDDHRLTNENLRNNQNYIFWLKLKKSMISDYTSRWKSTNFLSNIFWYMVFKLIDKLGIDIQDYTLKVKLGFFSIIPLIPLFYFSIVSFSKLNIFLVLFSIQVYLMFSVSKHMIDIFDTQVVVFWFRNSQDYWYLSHQEKLIWTYFTKNLDSDTKLNLIFLSTFCIGTVLLAFLIIIIFVF